MPSILCHRLGAMRSHELKAQIAELHPYEIPAIYSLEVVDVNASYLEWVNQNTL
ncbi:MAG: divalent cation tolerance protein CutA [Chromatium okenii]|nr:divalent cation tolerance protein CutA [Chromatium okenii]